MNQIYNRILTKLKEIEKDHEIMILFAVESGSRAWGFASTNSDYDVRFVYAHTKDWYVSIMDNRDVIEYPIDDVLDINGWDIRKALQLFLKCNPTLLEWIKSPIVYLEQADFKANLLGLEKEFFLPERCLYHYLSMAKTNYKSYLQREKVPLKKYFYALRPLLACEWIEKYHESPPMEFDTLINIILGNEMGLKNAVISLLERKKAAEELDEEPAIPLLNEYIEKKIEYFENYHSNLKYTRSDPRILDEIFRKYIV